MTKLFGQTGAPIMTSVLSREEHVVEDPQREKMVLSSAGRPIFYSRSKIVDDEG
jgi:hypothetical protein